MEVHNLGEKKYDLRSRAGIVDQEGSGAECEAAGGDSPSIAGASCQLQILSEESCEEIK